MRTEADTGRNPDADLARRAGAGDRDALGEILRRHGAAIPAAIWTRLGANAESEDLVQEALQRAVAGIGTLREPDRIGAWLYGIALRVATDWLRRRARRPASLDDVIAGVPAEPAGDGEAALAFCDGPRDRLDEALSRLGEPDREALLLHYLEGMDYEAMSRVFGITKAGVSQRLSRARARLRELLRTEETT